jgi:hypothetical protein
MGRPRAASWPLVTCSSNKPRQQLLNTWLAARVVARCGSCKSDRKQRQVRTWRRSALYSTYVRPRCCILASALASDCMQPEAHCSAADSGQLRDPALAAGKLPDMQLLHGTGLHSGQTFAKLCAHSVAAMLLSLTQSLANICPLCCQYQLAAVTECDGHTCCAPHRRGCARTSSPHLAAPHTAVC